MNKSLKRISLYLLLLGIAMASLTLLWRTVSMVGATAFQATTVTVTAELPNASELGPSPGIFKLTRTGSTSSSLTVNFTLGGTAVRNTDYLNWETVATFDAGSDTAARVTLLPRNDAVQEPNETVVLTLGAGAGYTVGSPSTATTTIADAFVSGLPGVHDQQELNPQNGLPLISPDLSYLDATISGGSLLIQVCLNSTSFISNVAIFLDTDRNPATGDYRTGHVAGQEYRVEAQVVALGSFYNLWRLRNAPLGIITNTQNGGSPIGVDYVFEINSSDSGGAVIYLSVRRHGCSAFMTAGWS